MSKICKQEKRGRKHKVVELSNDNDDNDDKEDKEDKEDKQKLVNIILPKTQNLPIVTISTNTNIENSICEPEIKTKKIKQAKMPKQPKANKSNSPKSPKLVFMVFYYFGQMSKMSIPPI